MLSLLRNSLLVSWWNGTEDTAKHEAECFQYAETAELKFTRLALMFKPGAKTQKLNPIWDIWYKDGLKIYGLQHQQYYGDNNDPEPFRMFVEAHLKWEAWNDQKGKTKDEAIQEGIDLAERLLQEKGFSIEDPMKGVIDQLFLDCEESYKKNGIDYKVVDYNPDYEQHDDGDEMRK